MKQSIKWHEQCLANTKSFLAEKRRDLRLLQEAVDRLENNVQQYGKQIEAAKNAKLDGFDRDRYKGGK